MMELEEKWDLHAPTEKVVFEYELHHPGLLRSFVSQIGSEAGVNALYWKDGVCLYEKSTRSRALIEQEAQDGWRGLIRLQTQGGQAAPLLAQLTKRLMDEQERWGIRSHESLGTGLQYSAELDTAKAALADSTSQKLEFTQEPALQPEYCVSYAWGDSTEEGKKREVIVDRLCDEAELRHIRVLRDKHVLGLGERISKFMRRIGLADRVFVVLSKKIYAIAILHVRIIRDLANSRQEEDDFLRRIRIYTLPWRGFSPR